MWVGRRGKGVARLRWSGGTLALTVNALQIVAVEGDDGERLAAGLGATEGGEWFATARRAVADGQVSQAEANAIVKRAVAETLRAFMLDAAAEVTFETQVEVVAGELEISFPHLMVELVLGPGGQELVPVLVPDPSVVLRRLPDFARRVGALGLTEEGMAILAKVNDRRTAADIAGPSPHGAETVLRLLAAALAGGIIEAVAPLPETPLEKGAQDEVPIVPRRRRRWLFWVLVLALAAAAAYLATARPWQRPARAGAGGPWGVAVDGGCQPAEVERLYRRQETDPERLRVVPFGRGEEQCFRLVWGHFATREEAEAALSEVPSALVARGFVPHALRPPDEVSGRPSR